MQAVIRRLAVVGVVALVFVFRVDLIEAGDSLAPDVAWWRMELKQGNQVPDWTGNGHVLTINGSPTFADRVVIFNDDGTLSTADSDALDLLNSWTISYWAREDSQSRPSNPSNGWLLKVRNYHDAEGGWALASDDQRFRVAFYNSNGNYSFDTPTPLPLHEWLRVTTTRDAGSGNLRIYWNNQLKLETQAGAMIANGYPVILGGYQDENLSLVPYCKGAMADVRIYSRGDRKSVV